MHSSYPLRHCGSEIIWLGDLIVQGVYESVHSRYDKVVNFCADDFLISVVDEVIEPGPTRIVMRGVEIKTMKKLELSVGKLVINDSEVLLYCNNLIYNSSWSFPYNAETIPPESITNLKAQLLLKSGAQSLAYLLGGESVDCGGFDSELKRQLRTAYAELCEGKVVEAVLAMRGRGYGSTPSGDDFNTGLLLGLGVRQLTEKKELSKLRDSIYAHSLGNNLMVNTFLHQARNMRLSRDWQKMLDSVFRRDEPISIDVLLKQGETSGADTLTGFVSAWNILI